MCVCVCVFVLCVCVCVCVCVAYVVPVSLFFFVHHLPLGLARSRLFSSCGFLLNRLGRFVLDYL